MEDNAVPKPRAQRKVKAPDAVCNVCDWATVEGAAQAEARQVSRVFHPAPLADFVYLGNGVNAGVTVGEPGYQLSTGEMVFVDS